MPAAAIPVIAGITAGAASTLVVTTATAIAIGSAVMSATMMLTMKKPSLGDYRSASELSQVLRAAASDKSCVYGRVVSSGLMSFAAEEAGEQDDGEWLHLALVLAGTKLTRIGDLWLGDDLVGTYGDLVSWELHADRQTCDPFMLEKCADWREDMIGQGITWLRLSLKFDAEKFPVGLPNIKAEKFGKEVWDPRDGKWKWSDNSALVILDYYRSWLKVPDDEIRMDEFIVAANICDEIVTVANGKVEPRYTTNVEFDLTEPRAKVLEALHMACCGQPTYIGGKFGILAGAYYGPASDELRPHQLSGDLELLPEPSSSDKINQVAGTFVDPITFKKTDFPAVIVPEWVEEDGGYPLLEDLDLRCVTSEYQAQRIANIILRQRRAARTITCSVNLSGWRYRPGQTIRFYLPAFGINGPEFRVSDWAFSLTGGVALTLREDSPLFWADAIGKPMERPEITELPTGGVAMPDQLRYDVETIGEVVQGVLTWRNSGTVNYNQVIVQRLEQGKAPVTVLTAQVPGQSCRINGLAAGNYTAMVRALALTGGASPVAAVNFVISAPATPIGVEVEAGNWTLAFRPKFAGGDGYGVLCEWWVSTINLPIGEVMEKARAGGMGTYMQFGQLKPDTTYYVWLRAVNAYGKSALLAASGKTTYDASSILDIIDGEIGAEHLREELRKPIELIPGINAANKELDRKLAVLDQREKDVNDLLNAAQNQLGANYVNVTLVQEQLRQLINGYKGDFEAFRDVVFSVDPSTGEITMEAVNAVRSELGAKITQVSQHLDSVEAIVKTCVTHAEISDDLEKITSISQQIDGINGTLAQTATKSEVTAVGSQVTQVGQELDAVNAALSQKAAKTEVDAQGQRLTVAEQKLDANTSATEANARRIEQLKSELQQSDQTIKSSISELAETVATEFEATARKVSALEALTKGHSAAISEMQEVISGDGQSLAGRFENMNASVDLAADAAIGATLAGDDESNRQRKATGQIRREQKVLSDQQQAMASELVEFKAAFEGEKATTGAKLTELREVVAGVEQSTATQLTQLQTEFKEGDRQTNAALQESNKLLSNADRALGEKIDTVQASVTQQGETLSSAVQTVAKAVASLNGEVEAGWYTKAQVNGQGGGFGLSVTLNPDGSVMSSFIVDADVFAIMSRASGESSKRHPFVVKNGSVYMNHAMMDTAEIGNVIAKYINVQHLVGSVIEGGSFRGGDIWLGENPNGAFGAYGKRWNAGIDSNGRFYGSDVYFSSGTFQGNVLANSGTMNNVTIRENCQILGKLNVNQIEGDVTRVFALESYISGDRVWFSIPAFSRTRNLVISGIEIYARGSTQSGGGDHSDKPITNSASCTISVNGYATSDSVSATGSGSVASTVCGRTAVIPPDQVTTVDITFSGGYRVRGSVAMVFTQ